MRPGGRATQVVALPHDNLIPLVARVLMSAQGAVGAVALTMRALHHDGTADPETIVVGFAAGTHDWAPGLGVLYPKKSVAAVEVPAVDEPQARL